MKKDIKAIAELCFVKDLITEVYPNGFVSIVSDTFNLWEVLDFIIPNLKDTIMARDGKVVIRPDSGDPVDIVCGNIEIEDFTNDEYCKTLEDCKDIMREILVDQVRSETPHGEYGQDNIDGIFKYQDKYYRVEVEIEWNRYDKQYYYIDGNTITDFEEVELTSEQKGVIEILWDIFGGTITDKGFKQLDPHIGCIYGDAITLERCEEICRRLAAKGFASTNMVFGIGSYTYQYNTRDTFGFALKSTLAVINGETKLIFKDPITDKDKFKKSQVGMVSVIEQEDGIIGYVDGLTPEKRNILDEVDILEDIFIDGKLLRDESLADIRARLLSNL